jgi:hypothetical protein
MRPAGLVVVATTLLVVKRPPPALMLPQWPLLASSQLCSLLLSLFNAAIRISEAFAFCVIVQIHMNECNGIMETGTLPYLGSLPIFGPVIYHVWSDTEYRM